MIQIIQREDQDSRERLLARLRERSVGVDAKLLALVAEIIADVRSRGDEALVEYSARFDGVQLSKSDLRVSAKILCESADRVEKKVLDAIRDAIKNVWAFHERQKQESWVISKDERYWIGQRINAIENVGLYVPGGTAAYPSSVIMNVVPAKIAGVRRIVVVTPPGTIEQNPALAAALHQLGVEEVYCIGGAQAIAALAYGTQTVPRVDKITGPGNRFVAAAKKLVFGDVGIDSIAGPTEVVIVADETARADFVAADLLAQAEHGEDASSLLLTTSAELARAVVGEVERQLTVLPRKDTIRHSLDQYGGILLFEDLDLACNLVNELAPEHVEIMTKKNEVVGKMIRYAGAIFFGAYSPEALGDYFAGPNHVLPTGRTARFSSGLGVYDFITRTNFVGYSPEEMDRVADQIASIAEAEGLQAHAKSALIRRRG